MDFIRVDKFMPTLGDVSPEEHGGGPGLDVLVLLVQTLALRSLALKLGPRAPPPRVPGELELADVSAPGFGSHFTKIGLWASNYIVTCRQSMT